MHEVDAALKNWKAIHDRVAQAERQLQAGAGLPADELGRLRLDLARLSSESDEALEELNRCFEQRRQESAQGDMSRPGASRAGQSCSKPGGERPHGAA